MPGRAPTNTFTENTLAAAFRQAGIGQPDPAVQRFARLAGDTAAPETILACGQALAAVLAETPAPDASLAHFLRMLEAAADPVGWTAYLVEQRRALEILVKLLVSSQHLTDTLVRQPELIRDLTQQARLAEVKTFDEFLAEALAATKDESALEIRVSAVRRFQRREILRIGAADTFGLFDLRTTTGQLSRLAEAILNACLALVAAARERTPSELSVLALGKLGGGELNYSSDIDLILLSQEIDAELSALAQQLLRVLSETTHEGFFYRVDLRLRPWGSSGPLVTTPEAYLEYLNRRAAPWERQALLKARVVAGDQALGHSFLLQVQPLVFQKFDLTALRTGIRDAKQRIETEVRRQGHAWGDVKSGRGSIRDIEFIVQFLQLHYGAVIPAVRTPQTLEALVRLADFDCLASSEYRQLTDAYVFLRTIEHALQLLHNQQRHALPTDPHELHYLAQRLDYPDAETLLAQYERHVAAVRAIYRNYLEDDGESPRPIAEDDRQATIAEIPLYETFYAPAAQAEHRQLLRETSAGHPVRIAAERAAAGWSVTVVGEDRAGDLSMTCGLFFVYGFDILEGFVSTAVEGATSRAVFVNTFTVRHPDAGLAADVWPAYETDLNTLFLLARSGEAGAAQGQLAKRVASAFVELGGSTRKLQPMQIDFDNESSALGTVLRLRADDSLGFLYELANALALCEIDIKSMAIRTRGTQVEDTLLVTDARRGGKIASDKRLRELNAAIVLIKQFTHLVPNAPNPEAALLHFRGLMEELFRQPNWVDELASLDRPDVLEALSRILGVSDFLWEDMLRLQYANLFPLLKDLSAIETPKSRDELTRDLARELPSAANRGERLLRLNAFKDREMFRIDMRHILGRIAEFRQFSAELSDLAEAVISAACELCWQELIAFHGVPQNDAGTACRYVVAALGKCGGRELGFASDIELLFLYEHDGATAGPERIANADFFIRFAELFTASIQARQEGIFQVDLRLRPYGRHGHLASSWTAFETYFSPLGPAWPFERQALVKLRPVAGDPQLGAELTALRDRLIYTDQPVDPLALEALREKQVRQLVAAGTFHAKLSPGALVDIEYLIQWLQLRHGHASEALRNPTTAAAAAALRDFGFLPAADFDQLAAAYWFFRKLIDALRMVRGNAQDLTVPPQAGEEFEFLARRLNYGACSRLQHDIEFHQQTVLALVRRHRRLDEISPTQTG